MARRYWPGADVIGRRLRFANSDQTLEVVGVARDGKYAFIGEDPRPYFFLPLAQRYTAPITVLVRTSAEAQSLAGAVRREVAALEPDLPAFGMMTREQFRRRSLSASETGATYSAACGPLPLALAAGGLA